MPKGPKPVYATDDEVNTAKAELHEKIDALKPVLATKAEVQEAAAKAKDDTKLLREEVDRNAKAAEEASDRVAKDSKAYTDNQSNEVLDEVKPMISKLGTNTRLDTDALGDRITETDAAIRKDFSNELVQLCENVDARFHELAKDMTELIEATQALAAKNLAKQRKELDEIIQARRQEAEDDRMAIRAEVAAEFARVRAEQHGVHAAKDQHMRDLGGELHGRIDKGEACAEVNRQTAHAEMAAAREDAAQCLDRYAKATDAHLAALGAEDERITNVLSRVMENPTRRIQWAIPDAATLLKAPPPGTGQPYVSHFSPTFHAAGGEDLQLELRVFPLQLTPDGAKVGVGNLALFLWASAGMQIAMRLFIGSRQSNFESTFSERMAHGTRRLCFLEDQVDDATGVLKVGVEFLEAIREMPRHDGRVPQIELMEPTAGSLLYQRHVNNRILPQVRKELERLQARLVRRVEWCLERASTLPQLFGPVEPICSPVFAAAGVEGMQILFYPSGYSGATEGFCSVYIFSPAGVTMKFKMTAGNQMRDGHNTFDEAGAYGRVNFCRFDILPDPQDDTILIAFEIEEVTQELHVAVGAEEKVKGKGHAAASPVESAVKLKRAPARESLVDVKPLPSMWTAKALGDMATPPDGYHAFGELKEQRGRQRGGRGRAAAAEAPHPEAPDVGAQSGRRGRDPASPASKASARSLSPGLSDRGGLSLTQSGGGLPRGDSLPQLKPTGGRRAPRRAGLRSPAQLASQTH